jgi:hypothetical protein
VEHGIVYMYCPNILVAAVEALKLVPCAMLVLPVVWLITRLHIFRKKAHLHGRPVGDGLICRLSMSARLAQWEIFSSVVVASADICCFSWSFQWIQRDSLGIDTSSAS